MTKKPKPKFHLLPNHYKIVGLCMMAAVFIPLILIHIGLQETAKEYLRLSAKAIFFSGWTLIAFSKDKDENSLLMTLRVYSATWAFFMAISSVIFKPIFSLLIFHYKEGISGAEVISLMLFSYFIAYYLQKWGINSKNKIEVDSTQSN